MKSKKNSTNKADVLKMLLRLYYYEINRFFDYQREMNAEAYFHVRNMEEVQVIISKDAVLSSTNNSTLFFLYN